MDAPTDPGYLFDNEAPEAGERFDALASGFDPITVLQLERLGVAEGWRCLEVGAGGGSVARWMADHVGASGSVLATDLDVRWLEQRLRAPNVEVRHHDIVRDPLPERTFDLVHERLVLVHVPERVAALRRLVSALRPGGWLLAEDFDSEVISSAFVDPDGDDAELGARIVAGIQRLLIQRGADPAFGHQLPRLLREAGLEEVGADGYQVMAGGDAIRALLRANITQVEGQLVDHQLVTRDELEHYLMRIDEGAINPRSPLLVSAWGRRPQDV